MDGNAARSCEILALVVVGGNNTEVMRQGIWTWSCTLHGGWVTCVRIKSGYEFWLRLPRIFTPSISTIGFRAEFHLEYFSLPRFGSSVGWTRNVYSNFRELVASEREQEGRPVLSVKRCFTPDEIFGKFHFARSGNVITATWICVIEMFIKLEMGTKMKSNTYSFLYLHC